MGLDIILYRVVKREEIESMTQEEIDYRRFEKIVQSTSESSTYELIPCDVRNFIYPKNVFNEEFELHDIEGWFKSNGYDKEDWNLCYICYENDEKQTYNFINESEEELEVDIDDCPLIRENKDFIYAEEIGWQRNGANKKFYKEMPENGIYHIRTKEEAEYHLERYFYKSRKNFKENIIDRFIDGECFIEYSW